MAEPLRILLHGARGRMGRSIADVAGDEHAAIAAACDLEDDPRDSIDSCDAVIDFSSREATPGLARMAADHGRPLVIGTTGHSDDEKRSIRDAVESAIPVVWAGNYSAGVTLLNHLVRVAAQALGEGFDPEVLELHHHHKKDAPSGTAEQLARILAAARGFGEDRLRFGRDGLVGARPADEIGVHSVRGGDIVGEHTVYFCGPGERVELTHRATDRGIFARGAVRAAHWARGRAPGIYGMEEVLGLGG